MVLNFENLNKICRICLIEKDSLSPIDNKKVFEKIEECLAIKLLVSNCLPNKICDECVNLINSCNILKEMVLLTEKSLNSFIGCFNDDTVKIENLEFFNEKIIKNGSLEADKETNDEKFNLETIDDNREIELTENNINNEYTKEYSNESNNKLVKIEKTENQDEILYISKSETNEKGDNKKIFECNACGKMLTTKSNLKIHMKVHNRIRQVKCENCGLIYATLAHLKLHHKKKHKSIEFSIDIEEIKDDRKLIENNNQYKCEICKKEFAKSNELEKHLQNFGEGSHMKCKYCNKIYVNAYFLQLHEENHAVQQTNVETKQIVNNFKCDMCDKEFNRKSDLKLHKKCHHEQDPYKCEFCGLVYVNLKKFQTHRDKLHKLELFQTNNNDELTNKEECASVCDEIKSFKCIQCDQVFLDKTRFYWHVRRHQNQIKCTHCDQMIFKYNMSKHVKLKHSNEKIEKTNCEICGRLVMNYEKHKKIHSNESQFECFKCAKKFNLRTQLTSHLLVNHNETNKNICHYCGKTISGVGGFKRHLSTHLEGKKYFCDICKRGYATSDLLADHKYRQHLRIGVFNCTKCPKKFKTKALLKTHYRHRHEDYRPYKCAYCSKAFGIKQALVEHTNTHTGLRPYECQICGDKFCFSGALYTHKKLKHKSKDVVIEIGSFEELRCS